MQYLHIFSNVFKKINDTINERRWLWFRGTKQYNTNKSNYLINVDSRWNEITN